MIIKADVLTSLIKSVYNKDNASFSRILGLIIASEQANKHFDIADRLSNIKSRAYGFVVPIKTSKVDSLLEVSPIRSFKDLILPQNIIKTCRDMVKEQHNSELLRKYNIEPRNRILLTGAPGNGKTCLAGAIAKELNYPFFVIRYENLIGSYLGETSSRLQKVFDYVSTQKCVLFFDEFDTIGKERGDTHELGEIKRVVSSLLLQMDRLPSYVVVITASNHPELLDSGVWRRFQIKLDLDYPNNKQISDFISLFSDKTKLSVDDVSAISDKVGNRTVSFSEVEDLCTNTVRNKVMALVE